MQQKNENIPPNKNKINQLENGEFQQQQRTRSVRCYTQYELPQTESAASDSVAFQCLSKRASDAAHPSNSIDHAQDNISSSRLELTLLHDVYQDHSFLSSEIYHFDTLSNVCDKVSGEQQNIYINKPQNQQN